MSTTKHQATASRSNLKYIFYTVLLTSVIALIASIYLQSHSKIKIDIMASEPVVQVTQSVQENRDKLRAVFADSPASSHGEKWSDLWDQGDFLPWDKGFPSPSLEDLVSDHPELFLRPEKTDKKRALVPGCGRGYDVFLFAQGGYDAVGLDISETAVKRAREFSEQGDTREKFQLDGENTGKVSFEAGDFFKDEWRGEGGKGVFDVIYDYTFFCALPPDIRPSWATRMAELLRQDSGILVCLEFPRYKDPSTGGPPWGVTSERYVELLEGAGLERILFEQPRRFHTVSQGSDMISVWRKKP